MLLRLEQQDACAFRHDETRPRASNGREARPGSSLFVPSAFAALKPATVSGVIAASVPPASATSASPRRMMFAASPMLSAELAQALTRL